MFNILSFEGNNQREINEFEENVQNSISKATNRCWELQKSKVRRISFNPFKENKRKNKGLFFPKNEIHYKKMGERLKGNKRENGDKEE